MISSWFTDPFGTKRKLKLVTEMLERELQENKDELARLSSMFKEFEVDMSKQMLLQQMNKALDESLDDMLWVKDLDGKYLLANKAIRDKLLFDNNPIGKNDITLSSAQKKRVGEENHTFGEICGNSDIVVVHEDKPMKFNEDGIVNGKYMMLQVNKNTIKDERGMIVGTVGTGRDITFEMIIMKDILEKTKCEYAKNSIERIIKHYAYEDRT